MYNRIGGVGDAVVEEGYRFRIPWFQRPIIYDIRSKARPFASKTGTKDLQTVDISLRILYRPDATRLPQIYRRLGTNFDERVLPSIVNEVLKSVVAQFNASQLIMEREEVSQMIMTGIQSRANDFGIIMDDVALVDLGFGSEYSAAVERKQIAQQNAQRAALFVEKARQQKAQKVVEAQAEQRSIQLIGNAVKDNPGFLQLRKIDAARDIAATISQSQNRVFLDAGSLMLDMSGDNLTIQGTKGTGAGAGYFS